MKRPSSGVAVLIAFLNTRDIDGGTDAIAGTAPLRDWLATHDLLAPRAVVTEDEVRLAVDLREGLRALLAQRGAPEPDEGLPAQLDPVLRRLPLRLAVAPGGRLALAALDSPEHSNSLRGLAAATADAAGSPDWARLKVCANAGCAWAFYDGSKNLSHKWCSMGVCGSRAKARAYRARRRRLLHP